MRLATPSIDPIILEKSKEIHDEWIHSASTITQPYATIHNDTVFKQLATNVVEKTTVLEKLNNFSEIPVDKKQKGMASIHPYFKKKAA